MIVSLNNRKNEVRDLLMVVNESNDENFYVTHENKRLFIRNKKTFKHLLKNSHNGYYEDSPNKKGIILVWKSFGGEKTRNYVKITSSSSNVARDLLTVLLWNYEKKLFVKLKKDSDLVRVFREKGFRFTGGRGSEVLMSRTRFSRE